MTRTPPAAAAGYYGPQPGQRMAGVTAGGGRRQQAPSHATTGNKLRHSGSNNQQAKTRQHMAGVDTGESRVVKSRRASDLSVERLELGHVLVGAALQQADRWMEPWDRLQQQGRSSNRHLRVSTPARSSEEKWRQGV